MWITALAGAGRRRRRPVVWLCAALAGLLSGCGQIRAPLPPSANLPLPVKNFLAERRGQQVRLSWITPRLTSDGLRIAGPIQPRICIWPALRLQAEPLPGLTCPRWRALLRPVAPGDLPQGLTLPLASVAPRQEASAVRLAIAFANREGQAAGWSNWQLVSLLPVSPPPSGLHAILRAHGIELHWHAPRPAPPAGVRLYRRQWPALPTTKTPAAATPAAPWQAVLDLPGKMNSYLDRQIQAGWVYQYKLRSLAGSGALEAVSAGTPPVTIEAQERLPPPAPVRLVAVLGLGTIPAVHLSWQAAAGSRSISGYNLYRQRLAKAEPIQPLTGWQRVNASLLPTPTGVDHNAWSGDDAVRYAVTGVDTSGRESPRSAAVIVRLPAGHYGSGTAEPLKLPK